jgi:hypothetical protein
VSNHLNLPLSQSPVQKWTHTAIIKCRLKLRVTFSMTNGGEHRSNWAGEAIIIKRADIEKVHAYARQHCSLRDFLIVHLPIEIGLRNSEIRTLRVENISFEDRSFEVLDSKKLELFPLPLDMLSLQLIKDLVADRGEGYVFVHSNGWKIRRKGEPLSYVEIWQITHNIAVKAGVKGYSPRMGRHYFAAHSIFDLKMNVVVLQRILRHKNLAVTTVYLSKLVFFEDIQKEFEGIRNSPLVPETTQANCHTISPTITTVQPSAWVAGETIAPRGNFDSICNDCSNVYFCKYAPLPEWRKTCVYKPEKKEELKI